MLVLSRSVGKSLVINNVLLLTVKSIDAKSVWLSLSDLATPEKVNSCALRENESVELFPDVRVILVAWRTEPPIARLGLEMPPYVSVYRKVVLDMSGGEK